MAENKNKESVKDKKDKLTPLEIVFCLKYVKLNDGTAAAQAVKPNYTKEIAAVRASEWLARPRVQAEIARLRKKIEDRTLVSKERVLKELAVIGFTDMRDYAEVLDGGVVRVNSFEELPENATRAVKKLKERRSIRADNEGDGDETIIDVAMEFELHDKLGALKEINKLQGYYPAEKYEVLTETYAQRIKRLRTKHVEKQR